MQSSANIKITDHGSRITDHGSEFSDHGSRITDQRKLALIGSNGMLAQKVAEQAPAAGYEVVGFDLPAFDLTNRDQVLAEMKRLQPAVIVNCAAYTNVDGAESDEELATRVNGAGPGYLAEAAKTVGAVLVHISTDYVFDGSNKRPYLETDPVGPISAYGRSKLAGEQAVLASGLDKYFIVRTSWLYGPGGKNFVETIIRLAREREGLRVVADQTGTPTYTGDLATAIFRLLALDREEGAVTKSPLRRDRDEETVTRKPLPVTFSSLRVTDSLSRPYGLYHFSNSGQCSWYEFAAEIIGQMQGRGASLRIKKLEPISTAEYPLPAPRPAYSVFFKDKYLMATGAEIPQWQESLFRYLEERDKESVTKNP